MAENENITEGQSITTSAPKAVANGKKPEGWSLTISDPFLAESVDELVEKYGPEVVLTAAQQQLRVKAQAAIRSMAEAGIEDEEIINRMASWKPGDKLGLGGDPVAATLKNFGNMSPEQREALIAQLMEIKNR